MAIMPMTLDKIVRKACSKLGNTNPIPSEYQSAVTELNMIMQDLQNTGLHLWKKQDAIVPVLANKPTYNLDPLIIDTSDWFFRREGSDTIIDPMTRTNYAEQSTKLTAGNPNRVFVDWQLQQATATFYPVYTLTTGFVLGTEGTPKSYLCTVGHTAAAANRPITGASWASYWELCTIATALNAWGSGTVYDSGCVHFTSIIRPLEITAQGTNPDAPMRWDNALVHMLAASLAPEYGLQQWERKDLAMRAAGTLAAAKAGGQESSDMRIFPEFRR